VTIGVDFYGAALEIDGKKVTSHQFFTPRRNNIF